MKPLRKDWKWYLEIIKEPLLIPVIYLQIAIVHFVYGFTALGNLGLNHYRYLSVELLFVWIPLLLLALVTAFAGYRVADRGGDYIHATISGTILGLIIIVLAMIEINLLSSLASASYEIRDFTVVLPFLAVVATYSFCCSSIGVFVAKNMKRK
jgi:hypothetical protein